MVTFLGRFGQLVTGVLSGFDRLFFRGSLRNLCYVGGLQHYLWVNRVKFKEFKEHSQSVTAQLIAASETLAEQSGRPTIYLRSPKTDKEALAKRIAARDRIYSGLIAVFTSVEPCMSFEIRKSRVTRKLEIHYLQRKCLHLYHYQMHPVFGFMHASIQSWFPFRVHVCLNGREWLGRQLDAEGLGYRRRDNCFTWLKDPARAQQLKNQQVHVPWTELLDAFAQQLHPQHDRVFANYPSRYYWSAAQSEWATDLMFHRRTDLEAIYPRLVRHGITTFTAIDVLRFLGRKFAEARKSTPRRFNGEVSSNVKEYEEGVRLKHWLNANSLKLYDKGSVLRAETTIVDPEDFSVLRTKEGDPDGDKKLRHLRYSVEDLPHRATIGQAANERYLHALAAVTDETPLQQAAGPVCQPTLDPPKPKKTGGQTQPRRVRALNPLSAQDAALLEAIARPEFLVNGLRNRDIANRLFTTPAPTDLERRCRSAAVTRKLRLLRSHGLIQRIPNTHRYLVPEQAQKTLLALLAARDASIDQLTRTAA
jgi:hypothetical protein